VGVGGGAGGVGGGGGYAVGYPFAGTHGWSYQNRFGTRVFRIRRNHNPWFGGGFGGGWFGGGSFGSGAFVRFDQRAPQLGWHVRRHATHLRDVQRSHNDQRIKASLKPHEALRKTLQKPDPASGGNDATAGMPSAGRSADEVQAAPPNIIEREAGQTVGMPSAGRPADEVQAAPLNVIEREAGQTVGMPSAGRSADEVQAAPPVIERKGKALLGIVMVVVGLGLIEFMFERSYAKHFSAKRSKRPQDYLRPLDLSSRPENQVEADPGAASFANSVKKALDVIEEAVAEMASSRQPQTLL
jgi:hypothetical protein